MAVPEYMIVGLGNSGQSYSNTRHNIGFLWLEFIRETQNFDSWKKESKFSGWVSSGEYQGITITLYRADGYMNLCGSAIAKIVNFYKQSKSKLLIAHDELDLEPGQSRLRLGGSPRSHNGLRSLHQHIGEGYAQMRIGIGHPGDRDRVKHWVLQNFPKESYDRWMHTTFEQCLEKLGQWMASSAKTINH